MTDQDEIDRLVNEGGRCLDHVENNEGQSDALCSQFVISPAVAADPDFLIIHEGEAVGGEVYNVVRRPATWIDETSALAQRANSTAIELNNVAHDWEEMACGSNLMFRARDLLRELRDYLTRAMG